MKILFFSHYFPPEGNAPASRTFANCRRWVAAGHEVTVITGVPNVPDGVVYEGYRNRLFQEERMEGIRVCRVWTYLAPNRGTVRRILNYLSYMISAWAAALFAERPDVVVATSPQFFCGWAGVFAARIKRAPFVLEIRDLWPESIAAVGAMKGRGVLAFLSWLERRLYAAAAHIVTVGEGYRDRLIERGVAASRISVVMNGVDRELFAPRGGDPELTRRLGLEGKFVCAYVGTVGMACGLDVVLEAAGMARRTGQGETFNVQHSTFDVQRRMSGIGGEDATRRSESSGEKSIAFLIVGDGAERERLEREARERGLTDVVFTGRVAKEKVGDYIALSDCCLVHLRKMELFTSVMPSKIFDAAGMAKPIVNGVAGFAARFVEESKCGVNIEPENAGQLMAAVRRLAADPSAAARMGQNGLEYVGRRFDRETLAAEYLRILASFDPAR